MLTQIEGLNPADLVADSLRPEAIEMRSNEGVEITREGRDEVHGDGDLDGDAVGENGKQDADGVRVKGVVNATSLTSRSVAV
jgi:hypothetical protein